MIFSCVYMQHHFMFDGMPRAKEGCLEPKRDAQSQRGMPSAQGCATKNGWMAVEIFTEEYLNHLILHTGCTKDNPILLILDYHGSHISIQAGQKAKVNGIILLTIPAHEPNGKICYQKNWHLPTVETTRNANICQFFAARLKLLEKKHSTTQFFPDDQLTPEVIILPQFLFFSFVHISFLCCVD